MLSCNSTQLEAADYGALEGITQRVGMLCCSVRVGQRPEPGS
jgi:hypothetical protein